MMRKKYIAIFLLIAIVGTNFVIPPKKAHAILGIGDLTIDVVQQAIKVTFNTAAHALARQIIANMVKSTSEWAASGFEGNPVFVQDPKQFFTNSANDSADAFIRGLGNASSTGRLGAAVGLLCSPFQKQIQLSLIDYYYQPANQQFQCTWTGIAGNLESFMAGNFSAGGWDGFISMTQVPTNNVYGAGITAQIALSSQVAAVIGTKQTDYTTNQGFLNIPGDCLVSNPSDGVIQAIEHDQYGNGWEYAKGEDTDPTEIQYDKDNGITMYDPNLTAGACIKHGPTKTPGSVISAQLNKTLGAGTDQLINAQDWDQIVSSLVQGLTKKIFSSTVGLFSKNPTDGLPSGNEASAINYTGPDVADPNIPDTNGPSDPDLSCTADTKTAYVANPATTVTWRAVLANNDDAEFSWQGSELATTTYATSTSVSLTYQIPTPNAGYFDTAAGSATSTTGSLINSSADQTYPYKTMYVTASTTDGQGNQRTIGPVICKTQVEAINYHPLVVSCSPKSNIVHAKPNTPVSWVATITGGSGQFQEIQWTGKQDYMPGTSSGGHDDWARIFPRNITDPTSPFNIWYYGNSTGSGTLVKGDSKIDAATGVSVQEFTANPNGTYTSTLDRVYLGDTSPIGDVDASIEVIDSDQTLPVVDQACSGTIHIDDN